MNTIQPTHKCIQNIWINCVRERRVSEAQWSPKGQRINFCHTEWIHYLGTDCDTTTSKNRILKRKRKQKKKKSHSIAKPFSDGRYAVLNPRRQILCSQFEHNKFCVCSSLRFYYGYRRLHVRVRVVNASRSDANNKNENWKKIKMLYCCSCRCRIQRRRWSYNDDCNDVGNDEFLLKFACVRLWVPNSSCDCTVHVTAEQKLTYREKILHTLRWRFYWKRPTTNEIKRSMNDSAKWMQRIIE